MTVERERLAELTTEGKVTIRKLGHHEEGECDCRATTAFSIGKKISVEEDLVPRSVTCQLDVHKEHPKDREFTFDPMGEVREDHDDRSKSSILV